MYLASFVLSDTRLNTAFKLALSGNSEQPEKVVAVKCYAPYGKCTWPLYNTLGICFTATNISDQVVKVDDFVTLPALQPFLPTNKSPPEFLSGTHVYFAQGQSAPASMPTTSISDGTNLPSLAEVYLLYYDVCKGRTGGFQTKEPKRWTALKGQFQFCIKEEEAVATTEDFVKMGTRSMTTNLNWYKTMKNSTSAFCTKVKSEKEDFCVSESIMEYLSLEMSKIYNTKASFHDMNRTDMVYGSEMTPPLTRPVFGGSRDTEPLCPKPKQSSGGGQNEDPNVYIGENGFRRTLEGVAMHLSSK